jgi:ADP-ribose pyrophosphatase YjhB (NUDIX family)
LLVVVRRRRRARAALLERADHPGFWQSVTGSKDSVDEPLEQTCRRRYHRQIGNCFLVLLVQVRIASMVVAIDN